MPESRYFLRSDFMADVPAELDGRRLDVFVYDLSVDGCMVETSDSEVHQGSSIRVHFDQQCMSGTVLWRKNRNLGVQFKTRMKSTEVDRLVRKAASSPYKTLPWERLDRSSLKVPKRKAELPRVRRRSVSEPASQTA